MSRFRNKKTRCLNCNYSFKESEDFCPKCGQENKDLKIPFKHFIEELVESLFHFDHKLWKTLKNFILYPGKITRSYLDGKRVEYIPPFRLFVFFGFIFYLALVNTKEEQNEGNYQFNNRYLHLNLTELNDSDHVEIDTGHSTNFKVNQQLGSNSLLKKFASRIAENLKIAAKKDLNRIFLKSYSYSFYILMPLLALVILLFYRKYYLYEHIITSIHIHCLIFFILSLFFVFNEFLSNHWIDLAFFIGIYLFTFVSLKNVYQNSWLVTFIKSILILCIYLVLLIISSFICLYFSLYFLH